MSIQFSYHSDLFDRFRNIHESDVYGVIRFYENHESDLDFMPFEERFIMRCYYSNALFAADESRKHLEHAQEILEDSIIGGIQYVDGHDVYLHTLQQKVESHIRLKEWSEAIKISKQLLSIAPQSRKKSISQMKRALLLQRPLWVRKAFGWGMLAMMAWTGFEVLQVLVLEPFYPIMSMVVETVQFAVLPFAALIGAVAVFGHYFFVERELWRVKKPEFV